MALSIVKSLPGVKEAKYRAPRPYKDKNGRTKQDNPMLQSRSGELSVAVGLAAISFATRSIARVRKEKQIIKSMWASKTTVKGLRTMVEQGKPLPEQCLVAGWIKADGPGVVPLTTRVAVLQPLLGHIDQPKNFYMDITNQVKADKESGKAGFASELAEKGLSADDIPDLKDDFTKREYAAAGRGSFVVSELLVTRLGCEATRRERKDKNGRTKVEIERNPKQARFNVHHNRQVASGLHVTGLEGEDADLELPEYDVSSEESPSLFLTLPDPMQEFKEHLKYVMAGVGILNANKPFTHLSKFIFLDQRSITDDGNSCRITVDAKSAGLAD